MASPLNGLVEGFQGGYGMARQRALDQIGIQNQQQKMMLEKAVQDRLALQNQSELAIRRQDMGIRQSELDLRQATEKRNQTTFDQEQAGAPYEQALKAAEEDKEFAPTVAADLTTGHQLVSKIRTAATPEDRSHYNDEFGPVVARIQEAARNFQLQKMATRGMGQQHLDPQTRREISGYSDVIDSMGRVESGATGLDPNIVKNYLHRAEQGLGVDTDPQYVTYTQNLRLALSNMVHSLSGAVSSDQERAYIQSFMPNDKDNLASALTKARNLAAYAKQQRLNRLGVAYAAGIPGMDRMYEYFNETPPSLSTPFRSPFMSPSSGAASSGGPMPSVPVTGPQDNLGGAQPGDPTTPKANPITQQLMKTGAGTAPAPQGSASPEDAKALQWLQTHQADPAAQKVREKLQKRGLL